MKFIYSTGEDSPAVPLKFITKVDPVFKTKDKQTGVISFGFTVHLGDDHKKSTYYFDNEDQARSECIMLRVRLNEFYEVFYAE